MKKLLLISSLLLTTSLFANEKFGSITVEEISNEQFKSMNGGDQGGYNPGGYYDYSGKTTGGATAGGNPGGGFPGPVPGPFPEYPGAENGGGFDSTLNAAGQVISTARDIVALGEAIYTLVQKGKPTNTTEYAPISVVPRDPISKEYIDPFDLEGFSMPVEKSFNTKIKNSSGKTVINFTYKVMYSYGGSYNGSGKYLTNVIIIPGYVKTSFGWDFNATMKLSGIMNHGTKADPIAGVMVTVKYQMNSWSSSFERNDTLHITGKGQFKSYSVK